MKKTAFLETAILVALCSCALLAQELKPVTLPKPDTTGGKPLMQALRERRTSRSFSSEKLPLGTLSDLLWAAFGINRPDGHRTAPSAMNWQEMDIYCAMENGLYRYDARGNVLEPVLGEDIREKTGSQAFVKDAPLDLVYVADLSKTGRAKGEDEILYTSADAGFIAQNVYLYCASAGLSVVVRGSVDRPALAKAMKLRPDQKIVLSQTVGFPKK